MKISNQVSASLALSKYSLLATLRSPTSVVFSLLFPIVFIVVFGSMVGDKAPSMKLAIAPGCDTTNLVFKAIEKIPSIILIRDLSSRELADAMQSSKYPVAPISRLILSCPDSWVFLYSWLEYSALPFCCSASGRTWY